MGDFVIHLLSLICNAKGCTAFMLWVETSQWLTLSEVSQLLAMYDACSVPFLTLRLTLAEKPILLEMVSQTNYQDFYFLHYPGFWSSGKFALKMASSHASNHPKPGPDKVLPPCWNAPVNMI